MMKKVASSFFFAAVLAMAVVATINSRHRSDQIPVAVSQNPVPACPPFCPDPNTGPDAASR